MGTAPVAEPRPAPTVEEGTRIVRAGQNARLAELPKCLNPHRDPMRREMWDKGWDMIEGFL